MDEKPKRGASQPSTGALILIGIGLFLLLANLGIIAGIGRLWPLILVVVGLWLLFGRSQTLTVRRDRFTEPVGGATSARIKLNLSVGEAAITAGSDHSLLLDADVSYLGDIQFVAQGEAEKFISLAQTGGFSMDWLNPANWFGGNTYRDLRWNIALNPDVPLRLDIHGGVGKSRIDLSRLRLSGLEISGGVGEADITLPAQSGRLDARVEVSVGKVDLTIPPGASVNAHVKGGVGETVITTPADAAVRLVAHAGIGDVSVPSRFQRISGDDHGIGKSGTWETPGFASADQRIEITFDGSVGQLRIR
jgi:hypothetical protein